jgi:hypothetical protein
MTLRSPGTVRPARSAAWSTPKARSSLPQRIAVTEGSATRPAAASAADPIDHPEWTTAGASIPASASASAQPSCRPASDGMARWWTVSWPMESRYRVARAATVRSSSETSQSAASDTSSRCSPPVATVARGCRLRSARTAFDVVSSWAMTIAGAPSCGSRPRTSDSEYVSPGSRTEMRMVNPAARAASSMPRMVSAVP